MKRSLTPPFVLSAGYCDPPGADLGHHEGPLIYPPTYIIGYISIYLSMHPATYLSHSISPSLSTLSCAHTHASLPATKNTRENSGSVWGMERNSSTASTPEKNVEICYIIFLISFTSSTVGSTPSLQCPPVRRLPPHHRRLRILRVPLLPEHPLVTSVAIAAPMTQVLMLYKR